MKKKRLLAAGTVFDGLRMRCAPVASCGFLWAKIDDETHIIYLNYGYFKPFLRSNRKPPKWLNEKL